jgi:threonine synthase
MNYQSTRSDTIITDSAHAIVQGLAPDGGLYVPTDLSSLNFDWQTTLSLDYYGMAANIISALLPDFSRDEALELSRAAYTGKFSTPELTPLSPVGEDAVLELFHGPTSAFKDMALCLLPHLLKSATVKCGSTKDVLILTATSGDTGKAAMEGFKDVPGVRIIVFYPKSGVSPVQEAQMLSQQGANVKVCAVEGNFDDAQTGVKRIFSNLSGTLNLSSANSINIGRLVPQVVYYFSAYASMLKLGKIKLGDKLDFVVPTGNFGDILAGYLAGELGLPVGRLVCASNVNNVLTDFFRTGSYNRNRTFHRSLSPSMDILVSSNLERLLYFLSGDSKLVAKLMSDLDKNAFYTLPADLLAKAQSRFYAGYCDDANTVSTISQVWQQYHYLMDTHTAVAWNVAQQYKAANPGHNPVVVLSTASPYKFPGAVMEALELPQMGDEFDIMDAIERNTGVAMPENLKSLRQRPRLHFDCVSKDHMQNYVLEKEADKQWKK